MLISLSFAGLESGKIKPEKNFASQKRPRNNRRYKSLSKKAIRLGVLENQVRRLKVRIEELNRLSDRYAWGRLAIFIGGVVLAIAGFYFVNGWLGWPLLVLTLVVFNIAAYYHRRVSRSIARHQIWLKLKTAQIARMRLDWSRIPVTAPVVPIPDHPFEIDLDLTGPRSIYQLINTAVSREGSYRLRDWLLATNPELSLIRRRQALVRELAPLSLFRDKLTTEATLAGDPNEQWEGNKLLNWLNKNISSQSLRPLLLFLSGLALLNLVLFLLSMLQLLPNIWVITLLAYVFISFSNSSKVGNLFEDAFALRDGLRKLSAVLQYLENYNYRNTPNLKKLCEPVLNRQERPSTQLRQVARLVMGIAIQKNGILSLVLNVLVPWDYFFAYRLNQAKIKIAGLLPGWLEVWFELEALNSLASFTYLNPDYSFATIEVDEADPSGKVVFEGQQLGHPLIPDEQRVCNDFELHHLGEIIIITGSNMAGKSSFLRTLGVNLCLAYAGGPVNAQSLRTSLFRLFSCIRVNDSVTEGYSYFYAEVRRLRALLDELDRPSPRPLFFLIDEIFRGTNNRERLIGSRSYLRALAGRNGVGAVSTHDLELIKLANETPGIKNFHFREDVVNGEMVFDYKLRPGPSPTTNALKIMKLAGLPVEAPQAQG